MLNSRSKVCLSIRSWFNIQPFSKAKVYIFTCFLEGAVAGITVSTNSNIRRLQSRCHLTHWGRYKTAAISQTFSNTFLKESVWIPIKISLKFVSKGPIIHIPPLVQTMAWRRPGSNPLSESMMVSLLTHICVTRPQWVKQDPCNFPTLGVFRKTVPKSYNIVLGTE